MEILIISGLSGSGKSKAASYLEDMGFYIVDNMPAAMILRFAEFCAGGNGRYDRVLLSHAGGEGAMDLLDSNIALCEDIINRNVDDVPFEFMGQKALLAKRTEHFQRLDGGSGNIVYNLDKLA